MPSAGRPLLQPRLYILDADTVFSAQLNQVEAASYPIQFLAYDNVTLGAYTDIKYGMTLLLGSTPGGDDYGRQRVVDGHTNISIFVGMTSRGTNDGELNLVDNAYITVLDEYRVWAKIPFIDDDGNIFKDRNLDVEWRTTTPPPVAVAGSNYAATIDSGTALITITLDGAASYATADSATITDYLWDIADGTLINGSLVTDSAIDVIFEAGYRWVSLTVTDSNGKTHTTRRLIYGRDPQSDSSVDIEIVSHRITESGVVMEVILWEDIPWDSFRPGTPCLLWQYEPTTSTDRDHMILCGYLHDEPQYVRAGRTGNERRVRLKLLDVAGKLDTLPGLPQSLADDDSRITEKIPDITWSYMVNPTLDKYIHYLLHWHSTALEVTDFMWSYTGDLYQFSVLKSDGASLWAQVDQRARAFLPDYCLTCDQNGRIQIVPDPMLRNTGDRTATVQENISEAEWTEIEFTLQKTPRVHWIRASAIQAAPFADLPLNGDSEKYIPTLFSIAPGKTPGQGVGENMQGEQLAIDQDSINDTNGHRYARENSPFSKVRIRLAQDDADGTSSLPWRNIEPAYKQWITITMSAATSPQRGIVWTAQRALPLEVNIDYKHTEYGTRREVTVTAEIETVGYPAETFVPEPIADVGQNPPPAETTVPDIGITPTTELLAGIGPFAVYRTADFQTPDSSGGPTWDKIALTETLAETDPSGAEFLSWVVDPFSPGYRGTGTAINGWAVSAKYIFKISNIFGAATATIIHTFDHALTGATYNHYWRTIQASFGRFQSIENKNPWLMVVSHYNDKAGHTGTWAIYSTDAGATWSSEVQISPYYATEASGIYTDAIGVYLSPKTPGYGISFAFDENDNPAQASAYKTLDWGATWTQMAGVENPSYPLPRISVKDNDDVIVSSEVTPNGELSIVAELNSSVESTGNWYLIIAPHDDTKSMTIEGTWTNTTVSNATSGVGVSANLTQENHIGVPAEVSDLAFDAAGVNETTTQNFTTTWTRSLAATQWTGDRAQWEGGSTTTSDYCRIRLAAAVSGPADKELTNTLTVVITVVEIELESGTIYTPTALSAINPGNGLAGDIHVPWPTNADEGVIYHGFIDQTVTPPVHAFKRVVSNVAEDITPVDSTIPFGVGTYGFKIRTFDGNRIYTAVAGRSTPSGNDEVGAWVSSDNGDTWAKIIGPIDISLVPLGFGIAFSGTDRNVLYVWGGYSDSDHPIYFTDDFGANLDSRKGNLGSLENAEIGAFNFLGICGGPTG